MRAKPGIPAVEKQDRSRILLTRDGGVVKLTVKGEDVGEMNPWMAQRLFGYCPRGTQSMEVEIDFDVTRTVTARITHSREK